MSYLQKTKAQLLTSEHHPESLYIIDPMNLQLGLAAIPLFVLLAHKYHPPQIPSGLPPLLEHAFPEPPFLCCSGVNSLSHNSSMPPFTSLIRLTRILDLKGIYVFMIINLLYPLEKTLENKADGR